ncbi:MAG: flagella basal body P-ring formation protein FlgA, partial [Pseudomonadota bacterium]
MKSYTFLLFFYVHAAFVQADDIMPVAQITQQTKAFLYNLAEERLTLSDSANLNITLRPIDSRLRLSQCDKKLAFALKDKRLKQFSSVKVSCNGTKPWSIYVGSQLALEKPILVANRELPRHHIVQKSDLSSRLVDIYSIRGGFSTRLSEIVGLQLKRALR